SWARMLGMTCIRISLIILCTLLMEVLHGSSAFVRTPPSPTKAAERIVVKVTETKTPLCQVLVTANPVAPLEGESSEPSEQEPGEAPSTVLSALLSDSDMHLS